MAFNRYFKKIDINYKWLKDFLETLYNELNIIEILNINNIKIPEDLEEDKN